MISRQKLIEELENETVKIVKNCRCDRYHTGMIAGIKRDIEIIKSQPPAVGIDKQKLIDADLLLRLCNEVKEQAKRLPEKECYTKAAVVDIIEQFADVIANHIPPADQWIPCSRELPKMNQPIIGTYENDGRRIVVVDNYFPQLLSGLWRLIAWMPAEPYRGE